MAIAVEGTANRLTTGAGTTFTLDVQCGTNANRYVIVCFSHQIYNVTISSITLNGHAMTSTSQQSGTPRLSVYEIKGDSNIATGTNTISVTIDQDRDSVMGAIAFSGVDQTTPRQAVTTSNGTSASPSAASIASTSGETLLGCVVENGQRTVSSYNNQTSRWFNTGGFGSGVGSTITSTSSSETLTWSLNASSTWKTAAFSITPAAATVTIEQEGFRWRNDDGNETTATFAANQDTSISAGASTNRRLRVLLNATGDPSAKLFQLEGKKSTDSEWVKI